jgi:hypothetical protein
MAIGISLLILLDTQDEAVKVVEALSRVATGLAFDGLSVSISIHTYEPDSEET